jgi:hypothetical protein
MRPSRTLIDVSVSLEAPGYYQTPLWGSAASLLHCDLGKNS